MEKIEIAATEKSPLVDFDPTTGKMLMQGRSLIEDTTAFYMPLVEWLKKYTENPQKGTIFDFKYEYFNTSCSKWLITITKQLKELYEKDPSTQVNWHYEDDDVLEYGEVICDLVDMPINMIEEEVDDDFDDEEGI